MVLNLSALLERGQKIRTVIGEKVSPFLAPPPREELLAQIRDEEEQKRREARIAVGLPALKQEELRRPTGGVTSILQTKITPEEQKKIAERELEFFGTRGGFTKPEGGSFVGIPFLGAVKKIIPKGLEGIVEKLKGMDKPTFLRQFDEGLKAQNLATRETATNVKALIKKSGFKDIGAFYDTHAPKLNTSALKPEPPQIAPKQPLEAVKPVEVPITTSPLIREVQKSSSAEEFVKAQTQTTDGIKHLDPSKYNDYTAFVRDIEKLNADGKSAFYIGEKPTSLSASDPVKELQVAEKLWADKPKTVPTMDVKVKDIIQQERPLNFTHKAGRQIDTPIEVQMIDDKPNLVDGRHRLDQARANGETTIKAKITGISHLSQLTDIWKKAQKP